MIQDCSNPVDGNLLTHMKVKKKKKSIFLSLLLHNYDLS